jgi:hypothetical protein
MTADHTPTPTANHPDGQRHTILRTRIGASYPAGLAPTELEDRIATAITEAITALGGTLDVLQVGLAARPDWQAFGPTNRATNAPLWDPTTDS